MQICEGQSFPTKDLQGGSVSVMIKEQQGGQCVWK